jgi:MFS family permease
MPDDVPASRLAILRDRDLRRYLSARFLVGVASQVQSVAVGWQVFELTRNPLDLGLVGLAQFLPFVVLILPAGHVADVFDRRRVQLLTYALLTVTAAALLAVTVVGVTDIAPILVIMLLAGVARAFNHPTSQALLANLAPAGSFPQAVAFNSTLGQVATIAGPALGGLLIVTGIGVAYALTLVLLVVGTALVVGLRAGGRGDAAREAPTWATVFSGLRFVRSRPVVLGSISLDLVAVLFGGAEALLPFFAGEVLDVGPVGLGVMRASPAVGAAILALVMTVRPIRRHVGRWLFGSVAVFGLATIVFGISTSFPLSVVALLVIGAADMVSVFIRHLLVQLETPDEIRGRVSAVNSVFISASNEIGAFESGITAAWWGIVPAVLVGGVGTIVVAGLWMLLFPVLRRLDRFPTTLPPRSGPASGKRTAPVSVRD